MNEIRDLDIDGRESVTGTPYVLNEAETIEQALKMFLSYASDRVYYPEFKGVLKRLAFKQINDLTLDSLKFDITTEIVNNFVPNIVINVLEIVPDKQNRLLELKIDYSLKNRNGRNTSVFFIKHDNILSAEKFNYQDIDYVGENLYLWVGSTKFNSEVQGKKLIFNYDEDSWTWGIYRLINLKNTDPYFSEILNIINVQG